MAYIIVKYAAPSYWESLFPKDPQLGVPSCYSAYNSYTGQECGCESSYQNYVDAEIMLRKMKEMNPSVGYAICPQE